jgi:hypothetical protein
MAVCLLATLKAASASFERGNLVAGLNQLHAFQNKVRAQVADAVLADQLTKAAQVVMDVFLSPRPDTLPARVVPAAAAPPAAPPAAAAWPDFFRWTSSRAQDQACGAPWSARLAFCRN